MGAVDFFAGSKRFMMETICCPNTSSSSKHVPICMSALLSSLSARLSSNLERYLISTSSSPSPRELRFRLGAGWTDEPLLEAPLAGYGEAELLAYYFRQLKYNSVNTVIEYFKLFVPFVRIQVYRKCHHQFPSLVYEVAVRLLHSCVSAVISALSLGLLALIRLLCVLYLNIIVNYSKQFKIEQILTACAGWCSSGTPYKTEERPSRLVWWSCISTFTSLNLLEFPNKFVPEALPSSSALFRLHSYLLLFHTIDIYIIHSESPTNFPTNCEI